MTATVENDRGTTRRGAKYYPVARLVHLERMSVGAPADLVYSRHRQDWDDALAASTPGVYRRGILGAIAHFWRHDYACVELPEPLAIPLLPHTIAVTAVLTAKNRLRPGRTELAFYAIENLDQAGKLADATRLPRGLARLLVRLAAGFVVRRTTRIAYGTDGARENYRRAIGAPAVGGGPRRVRGFEALPGPDAEPVPPKQGELAVFLGSFETRKGIDRVLRAWSAVRAARPDARLAIVGHGPLEAEVRAWVSGRGDGEVELQIDPPRARIRETLRRAHCLVLPSVRTPTWQEQVGLPIVEALEQGCEIVTSDETGIARWLVEHGHGVLTGSWSDAELAAAIVAALGASRTPAEVQSELPAQDSRLAAELWMFGLEP